MDIESNLRTDRATEIYDDARLQFSESEQISNAPLLVEYANAFDTYITLRDRLEEEGYIIEYTNAAHKTNPRLNPISGEVDRAFRRWMDLAKQLKLTPKTKGDKETEIDLSELKLD